MDVNFTDKETKYSEASGNRISRGAYLGSRLLIRKTNPDLRLDVTSNQYAGWQVDPTCITLVGDCVEQFHRVLDMLLTKLQMWSQLNMNKIIQGVDFGAFPWLIGCELTRFLSPSCCLLVTVANNHHLNMLSKGCTRRVSPKRVITSSDA